MSLNIRFFDICNRINQGVSRVSKKLGDEVFLKLIDHKVW